MLAPSVFSLRHHTVLRVLLGLCLTSCMCVAQAQRVEVSPSLFSGKPLHFAPKDGVYAYFRYNDETASPGIMVVVNKGEQRQLELERFSTPLTSITAIERVKDNSRLQRTVMLEPDSTSGSVWLRH